MNQLLSHTVTHFRRPSFMLNESTRIITGHVIYNPAYTYKFQLKTTQMLKHVMKKTNKNFEGGVLKENTWN